MRLLLIEDDTQLAGLISALFQERGFQVDAVDNGCLGQRRLRERGYDVCVLDRMLPGVDGLTLLQRVRQAGVTTPVLMLTAMSRTEDLVEGFAGGADDYLAKPFAVPELLARVNALLRRSGAVARDLRPAARGLSVGDLRLNLDAMTLSGPVGSCSLTRRELETLALLLATPGEVVPRERFFDQVWGPGADVGDAALDTYIYFLRRKLAQVGTAQRLTTRRGTGYLLEMGR